VDPSAQGAPVNFAVTFAQRSYLVDAVRVTLNTSHSAVWEEIDAVGLSGVVGTQGATPAESQIQANTGQGHLPGDPATQGEEPLSLVVLPERGAAPLEVTAIAVGGPAGAEYVYDFGDGSTGRGSMAVHTYVSPGTYTVTVRAGAATARATIVAAERPANE